MNENTQRQPEARGNRISGVSGRINNSPSHSGNSGSSNSGSGGSGKSSSSSKSGSSDKQMPLIKNSGGRRGSGENTRSNQQPLSNHQPSNQQPSNHQPGSRGSVAGSRSDDSSRLTEVKMPMMGKQGPILRTNEALLGAAPCSRRERVKSPLLTGQLTGQVTGQLTGQNNNIIDHRLPQSHIPHPSSHPHPTSSTQSPFAKRCSISSTSGLEQQSSPGTKGIHSSQVSGSNCNNNNLVGSNQVGSNQVVVGLNKVSV